MLDVVTLKVEILRGEFFENQVHGFNFCEMNCILQILPIFHKWSLLKHEKVLHLYRALR